MSPIFTYAAELYREMREEFELSVETAHAAAEEGTGGAMLNKHGRAEGIDAYSLMTGPWSRVERYGSPELIEWCQEYGRPSVARFEREWFTSWLGEMPEPDALQEQLDGIRAVYTPERMAIERALAAAGPPRMMNRREANETLNKVLDILRGVERPVALGFDGSSDGIVLSFPNDPHLTEEMRRDIVTRFRDAQGLYPVVVDESTLYQNAPANVILAPNTEVQLNVDRPSYWGTNESWPSLAVGYIIGVETTDMERPVYTVRVNWKGVEARTVNVLPESFTVVR